jgi:acetolactate synthase-1/2/3 large subunit
VARLPGGAVQDRLALVRFPHNGPVTERSAGSWTEIAADSVGEAIVAALAAGGVDHIFFTSGSDIAFLQEAIPKAAALGRHAPIRLITVPHEHVGLNAALGYAAVSGRPTMTAAHVDAGTLNYGGAIHTAWRSGLPVLITAGSPPTAYAGSVPGARDEGGHLWMQESFDQHSIVRGYTKWDHRLTGQDDPGLVISRAIQVARSEPAGPVYLSFPKELVLQPTDGARFPSASQLGIPRPAALDTAAADEVAERLIGATSPVVVVSRSGRDPATVAPLVALAEAIGLAVVDAAQRAYLCFPMRHPLRQPPSVLRGPTSCSSSTRTCRGSPVAIRRQPRRSSRPSATTRSRPGSRHMSSRLTSGRWPPRRPPSRRSRKPPPVA